MKKISLFFVLISLLSGCKRKTEENPVLIPEGGVRPVNLGKIDQAQTYIRLLITGSDLLDRASIIVSANLISVFYGIKLPPEDKMNEEKIVLDFCEKRGFPVDNAWKCSISVFKDVVNQSEKLLQKVKNVPIYKKHVKNLLENTAELKLEVSTLHDSPVLFVFGNKRPHFSKENSGFPYIHRLPAGVAAVLHNGTLKIGTTVKIKITEHKSLENLLNEVSSLTGKKRFSLLTSSDEKSSSYLPLLSALRYKGVAKILLWGEYAKISSAVEVKLTTVKNDNILYFEKGKWKSKNRNLEEILKNMDKNEVYVVDATDSETFGNLILVLSQLYSHGAKPLVYVPEYKLKPSEPVKSLNSYIPSKPGALKTPGTAGNQPEKL